MWGEVKGSLRVLGEDVRGSLGGDVRRSLWILGGDVMGWPSGCEAQADLQTSEHEGTMKYLANFNTTQSKALHKLELRKL